MADRGAPYPLNSVYQVFAEVIKPFCEERGKTGSPAGRARSRAGPARTVPVRAPFGAGRRGASIGGGSTTLRPVLGVSSIGQCNTSCSLLAGVSKAKVFRGR
jgi:hypothetical protein